MIHYKSSGRYEPETHEFALTAKEWAKLSRQRKVTLYNAYTGAATVFRKQTPKEEIEDRAAWNG